MPRVRAQSPKPIFDIKPVDQSGRVDLAKITNVKQKLNLRKSKLLEVKTEIEKEMQIGLTSAELEDNKRKEEANVSRKILEKNALTEELRRELWENRKLETVLAEVGGEISQSQNLPVFRKNLPISRDYPAFASSSLPSPAAREVEIWLQKNKEEETKSDEHSFFRTLESPEKASLTNPRLKEMSLLQFEGDKSLAKKRHLRKSEKAIALSLVLVILAVLAGFKLEENFQKEITQGGNQAVQNIEAAKAAVAKFDFATAASHFGLAYDNFSDAFSQLNLLGNSLSSFVAEMPGLGKLKSAQNLIKAGADIAKAGQTLSLAANGFYQNNFASSLGLGVLPRRPITGFVKTFKEALVSGKSRLDSAGQLLADVDASVIPEEKRQTFFNFKVQLPVLRSLVAGAVDYSDFLLKLVGDSGPKKYLILFENNTELRPAGGFPGTYAFVDFDRGLLRNMVVDDVYNIDGQAKKNIIPPKELQHITPTWGMRDANWFANFPDSAKKIMQMYTENDGGPAVDGVIALTPTVISKILEIIGPVDLPEYGMTIDSANFLAEIQKEVEYGENRAEPKKVLIDFAPHFFEKLSQQGKEKWLDIFKALAEDIEGKQVLAYFKDPEMEKSAIDNNFGGEVKKTDNDYISVINTNVKGSKTDAVIDNSYDLRSAIGTDGTVEHALTITRSHKGGNTKFGFYNRENFDYIRVMAPQGSVLESISGQSKVSYKPLIDYGNNPNFQADEDLKNYEADAREIFPGVKQFSESGKTVFGFWLNLQPGQTKSVILKYQILIPTSDNQHSLLVQKQAGATRDKFNFSLELPAGKKVIYKYPDSLVSDGKINWQGELVKDMILGVQFQ